MDYVVDPEDQLVGVSALLLDAIDAASDFQVVRIGDQAFVRHRRPQRAESVHRFPDQELASVVKFLPVASGNVLRDGVTEHVVESVRFGYVTGLLPDDNGQLHLPVELLWKQPTFSIQTQAQSAESAFTSVI